MFTHETTKFLKKYIYIILRGRGSHFKLLIRGGELAAHEGEGGGGS